MTLLAIDCATNACSAALWLEGALGPHRFVPMRHGHGEAIMPMIEAVMAEAGMRFDQLDAIAVTVGPGGFTGLRIGLAAARGLALAAERPLIGVTTLEAVAAAHESYDGNLLIALDSRRADIYAQLFGPDGAALTDAKAVMPEEVASLLPMGEPVAVAGDAADTVMAALERIGNDRTHDQLRESALNHKDRADPPGWRIAEGDSTQPGSALGSGMRVERRTGADIPDAAVVARLAAARMPDLATLPQTPAPAALYLRPPDAVPAAERRRKGTS